MASSPRSSTVLRRTSPTRPYLFVGPVLATVAQLRAQRAATLRYGSHGFISRRI